LIDLSSDGSNRIDIDLADVEFLDSTALSVLVQAKRRLNDSGRQVGIVNPRPRVQRVLELAGLLEYLQA
jgi:anti-anti-sigma factor